jgi:hypothetical protein
MTTSRKFKTRGKVWVYHGPAAWHFVTLPKKLSAEIKAITYDRKSAWGSVRVAATIGTTSWKSSLFPDSKAGAYLLPIKADVRKREKLAPGSSVMLILDVGV